MSEGNEAGPPARGRGAPSDTAGPDATVDTLGTDSEGADTDGTWGTWETVSAAARTLQGSPMQTQMPQAELESVGTTGRQALGAFEAERQASAEAPLVLGEVIGEGGRGIVRAATQTAMGREVAVKAVRPSLREALSQRRTTLELLQEAWITGRLEHPNIIPVYDIASDEDGQPLIVLKRIEGESWASLLAEPERARERLGLDPGDPADPADLDEAELLDAHLRVLMAVCTAVHFAHDRRILHLDIKPENVMLGSHGEIYVADWGVAASLAPDPAGKLPLAARRSGIVGTPSYMAPEMALGDGERLDERTDVYLLGATLHELIAGRPPHGGRSIMEVLYAVSHTEPRLPEHAHAPPELAEICRKAMAREPEDRYASAQELRRAIADFRSHRVASHIANEAQERLDELEALLVALAERARAEAEAGVGAWDEEASVEASSDNRPDPQRRKELFAQIRFGFEQSLAAWPENEAALRGLVRARELIVRYELDHGAPAIAVAIASRTRDLPAELLARVDEAYAREQGRQAELERIHADHDPNLGRRTRSFMIFVLSFVWIGFPLYEQLVAPEYPRAKTFLLYGLVPVLSLAVLAVLRVWARDSLTRTHINRLSVSTVALGLAFQLLLTLAGYFAGLGALQTMAFLPLVWACVVSLMAMAIDARGLVLGAAFGLATLGASVWTDFTFAFIGAANSFAAVAIVSGWWPRVSSSPN
ncbi:probable serine/threonine-protein kinase [Plesiocystis pacifica SIR-1]|uniref:Probable serine/threonine-protein kinase n=1 Tax=Plesiocystis pacifica SIR-1 TaxID=391625 RepID=A6GFS5_9BACT|nr:serine/threonine-protein kinase [Plesiocystis pacifica]EDM75272.1 probable serine/threonine-protein kinase [Plesiocystis pacifica SIR-1]